jgi:TonB family protein
MIHVAAMALLALALNQSPNTARAGGKAKFPTRTEKPKPPPPQEPSQDSPAPTPPEDDEPRPQRPPVYEDPQSIVLQTRQPGHLAVIRRNMPQIENCYARARSWSPALQGEVVVEWDITPGGDVTKAQVTANSTSSSELADCVLQAVKTWTFREPNEAYPTHVRHPFRFQSS